MSAASIPQHELLKIVLPLIRAEHDIYRKSSHVLARPAKSGELVHTVTGDGKETSQHAREDQVVVKNMTVAKEEYVVDKDEFEERYTLSETIDEHWKLYTAMGEIKAIEVTPELQENLGVGDEFHICAAWKEKQKVKKGDYLVAPYPKFNEVYRIAAREFRETYKLKKP